MTLETCETMNNAWGFNSTDTIYKSSKQLIHYLVNASGRNANFLLNVGPMPKGKIQQEFQDTLQEIGKWLGQYGESIYGTTPAKQTGIINWKVAENGQPGRIMMLLAPEVDFLHFQTGLFMRALKDKRK